MDPDLFTDPPPLDPAWLAHEKAAGLLISYPAPKDYKERQALYIQRCNALNAELLSGRDKHLTDGIQIQDTSIDSIPIRIYTPTPAPEQISSPNSSSTETSKLIVIYYHGGGLLVGDLSSEDLSCRRICLSLQWPCIVYSIAYRLLPENTADDALSDTYHTFEAIASIHKHENEKLILFGSSSGGQLAAQVSQRHLQEKGKGKGKGEFKICGVLLRCPVTCDASNLPERCREKHHSMDERFYTSLLSSSALTTENRSNAPLPLEAEDFSKLPRHWIQVCTNDIYYSDGLLYAEALREAGVDVKIDVVWGWPHTFWLKAPFLERAVEAEREMVEGLRWLVGIRK